MVHDQVLELLSARQGHFLLESGHHGDLWLDLETLCQRPQRMQPLTSLMAERLVERKVDAVCGPLVEGAFVGLMVATSLDVGFAYSERIAQPTKNGIFPAGYRIPRPLREGLRGKRVAIVNDVINAGSAVRGTFADLERCGAIVVAISTLLVLGTAASAFAASKEVPLHTLTAMPSNLWAPLDCPLCASGVPVDDVAGFAFAL